VIYYEYNGTIITRLSKDGETYFYHGKCDDNIKKCPESFIKAEHSGFNSSLDCFLLFRGNGFIELINNGGGYFTEWHIENKRLFMRKYDNSELPLFHDAFSNNYNNLIRISSSINLEKKRNANNNSKVKVIYPEE
jgi:hypothetical protein